MSIRTPSVGLQALDWLDVTKRRGLRSTSIVTKKMALQLLSRSLQVS